MESLSDEGDQVEDLEMLAMRLPKMRAKYVDLIDKIELFKSARSPTQQLEAQCWTIRREAYPILVKLFDACMPVTPSDFGWTVEQLVSESLRNWLC